MHTEVQDLSCVLKDFFLETPISGAEYIKIHSKYFPPDIKALYPIGGLINEYGYVYIRIKKCMYGLKQADSIAYKQLISHMDPQVYYTILFTTGLWAHQIRRTKSCHCVDDFGVKYFSKDDADHLLESLKNHYAISTYWEGHNYLGFTINWNYNEVYVYI